MFVLNFVKCDTVTVSQNHIIIIIIISELSFDLRIYNISYT